MKSALRVFWRNLDSDFKSQGGWTSGSANMETGS